MSQVLKDLRLREFRATERTTNYDQEILAQYMTDFFGDGGDTQQDTPETKPQEGKGRRSGKSRSARGQSLDRESPLTCTYRP